MQKAKQLKGTAITDLFPWNSWIISLSSNTAVRVQIQCYRHLGRFDLIKEWPPSKNFFSNSKSRQTTGKFGILFSKTMSMCLTAKKSFLDKHCSLLSLKDLNAHVLHSSKNGMHFSTYFISWLSKYFKKDKWKNIFHDVFKSFSYGFAEIDSSAQKERFFIWN